MPDRRSNSNTKQVRSGRYGQPNFRFGGHGYLYGRFDEFDVRKAFWQCVLSGAGFTYGAHGLWGFHWEGAAFTSEAYSKMPFDWRTSLALPGARNVGYCKWIFEQYGFHKLVPACDLLVAPFEEMAAAASPDRSLITVYVPYANDVELAIDTSGMTVTAIDLKERFIRYPVVVD